MPHPDTPLTPAADIDVSQANPVDLTEQSHHLDLGSAIEDYPWVRRDEVLTIGGHRYFI